MTLRDNIDKLKAEALVLSTCFGLNEEQLAPVEQAIALEQVVEVFLLGSVATDQYGDGWKRSRWTTD